MLDARRLSCLWLLFGLLPLLVACGGPGGPASGEEGNRAEAPTTAQQPASTAESSKSPRETRERSEAPNTTETKGVQGQGDRLVITFLDVGQGSSALLRLPNGQTVLIDGGPREGGPQRVADLQRLGVDRLDAVVISHADEDHAGGLVDVIDSVPVSG